MGSANSIARRRGSSGPKPAVPAQQRHQIGHRNAEDRTGQVVLETGHQRRDVTAHREGIHPDRHARVGGPDPGQQAPHIPHRLCGEMHIVEDVLTGKRLALRHSPRSGAVHGMDGQHDVQPEILVQVPRPEQGHVDAGAAHLQAVNADQPRPGFAMAEHQPVHPLVPGVAQPAVAARLTLSGRVAAVEEKPLMRAATMGHRQHGDVRQRGRWREEPFRVVQPAPLAVEVQRVGDLALDAAVRAGVTQRALRPQPGQHDLVAQRMGGQPDRGPCHRKRRRFARAVVPPRPRVVATGPGEGTQDGVDRTSHVPDGSDASPDRDLQASAITATAATTRRSVARNESASR